MTILTDESLMPFGKYKGAIMSEVPCSYLHWLWHNGMKGEDSPVANYIRENISVLKTENKDLIWDKSLI